MIIPLITILLLVWNYGMRIKMPGFELEYYPVERVMTKPVSAPDKIDGYEAEKIMKKEGVDLLNILDEKGLFKGLLTKSDLLKARSDNKMRNNIKKFMTMKDELTYAKERENLKSIMKKIGETKHSRLPVLNKDKTKIIGLIDSVDINDIITKIL
jgi:CBS domain-containing protein